MLTTSSDIATLFVFDGLDNPVGLLTDFATNTVTYTYDDDNHVLSLQEPGGTCTTGTTAPAASSGCVKFSYTNGNQTSNGATSQSQSVNSSEAVTAEGSTNYSAFGGGNATTLTRSASSSSYTSSALGLMSETTSTGTTAYTRTAAGDLVDSRTPSGADLYYILDSGGSVVGMFDKTGAFVGGYSYSPYGETRSSTTNGTATNNALVASNSMRYGGGYYDTAVGLYRFSARYYDPTLGRFTQADPSGGESNPYSYASDSPINSADISGLFSLGFSIKGCYVICLSVGLSTDQDGNVGLTGGVGVGNPSLSASAGATSGDVETGGSIEASCSYGPAEVSANTSGEVGASVGSDISTGECDAGLTGEVKL